MCRLIVYTGHPVLFEDILVKPSNSLISQSMHATESEHPLNGDGFGLGWYEPSIDDNPALFRSIQPAWNNMNLRHLAGKIKSPLFFGHVRAASQGGVANDNTHPFIFNQYLFMHNGTIHGFQKIKRAIRRCLDDDIYDWTKGQTDSEHFFALLLQTMRDNQLNTDSIDNFYKTLILTIERTKALLEEYEANPLMFLNIALSDGKRTIVSRYVSVDEYKPRTLHYAVGDRFLYEHGEGHMYPVKDKPGAILVSSERLTDYNFEWHAVAENHCILIDEDYTTGSRKILVK